MIIFVLAVVILGGALVRNETQETERKVALDGEVLLNGDHAAIRRWRRRESLAATLRFRPDLLETAVLSPDDRKILKELEAECSSES